MKGRAWIQIRTLALSVLAASGSFCRASSPSGIRLGLQPQTGLSITGVVGTVYAVQYPTNVINPVWSCLTFHKAPAAASTVAGTVPAARGNRFYRVTAISGTNLVFISPGTFTMGSPTNE